MPDCSPLPAAELTNPVILGDGTPGSVSQAMLQAALDGGGPVLIDQGAQPSTITLSSELIVRGDGVLAGAGLITLDGQNNTGLIRLENPNNLSYHFVVQGLRLRNARKNSESGAAIFKPVGGPWQAVDLTVINSHFTDNTAIAVDQDGGGGAIYAIGLNRLSIGGTVFDGNRGSNGGAVYSLGSREIKIVDSSFNNNIATGFNGNPGNGGNGGAMGVDGAERQVVICRSDFIDNQANAFGAGFFTVMYDTISLSAFEDVNFIRNLNPGDFGFAAGAYLQGGPFRLRRTSFIDNQANSVGGLFLGPQASGEIVNSTFYGNIARTGLAGAISIDSSVVATIAHSTVANNHAPGDVGFVGGIQVSASNQITMSNTLLANNTGGNVFNPWNIRNTVADGGGNMQFPRQRPNGQDEVPATASVIWDDPLLENAADNGGMTLTMALPAISPAIDLASGSPSIPQDQRGVSRLGPADIGAYEFTSDTLFTSSFE
ncbi:MAG: choice-of-anchor Q domain-containing protein [Wenzhouxiangellaceae bacterium]